jgi:hypothetical protein
MAGIAYSAFNALPDIIPTDRFQLLIVPIGGTGTNADLMLRCQQVVVPEESIEPMLLQIHGMEFSYRGRRVYDKALGVSFVETSDMIVSSTIATWMENIVGAESEDSATAKAGYVTVGTLNVLDNTGATALAYQFDNLWPSQKPQTQLDGSSANPFIVQVTFTFDRMRLNGVTVI